MWSEVAQMTEYVLSLAPIRNGEDSAPTAGTLVMEHIDQVKGTRARFTISDDTYIYLKMYIIRLVSFAKFVDQTLGEGVPNRTLRLRGCKTDQTHLLQDLLLEYGALEHSQRVRLPVLCKAVADIANNLDPTEVRHVLAARFG